MSQNYTLWEINGKTYEYDLQDADNAAKYEEAFDKLAEEEKNMPKTGRLSDSIKAYHQLFVNLYDRLFGEGKGIEILGDKANTRICNEVYDSFLNFVKTQRTETLAYQNNMISKYSPNRAQRRASAKK